MAGTHRIVVSTENNPYAAWQTKLFHYSCLSRLGQAPVVVVHESARAAWHPDFHDLVRAGAVVRRAPTYRRSLGDDYPPRNTAGTLLHAAELCDAGDEFIVLCDPDMIFARRPAFPSTLSGDYYPYMMDYDRAGVREAAARLGVTPAMIDAQREELHCGVPYVIPVADAVRLGRAWLEAINSFDAPRRGDMMHAFGLAVLRLGMRVMLTHLIDHNYWQREPLTRDVVHYCYGDDLWDKRHYFYEAQAPRVWEARADAPPGSVLSEILTQLREAREFYRPPSFLRAAQA